MDFGKAIGTACSSFAATNIDDMFVLVTFFAECSSKKASLTPWKIVFGQYVGFSVLIIISMIGFGASLVLPSEPIGFMGLLPILLGTWKTLGLIFSGQQEDESTRGVRSVFKVSIITIMNGGDNIGTYIPLFSQAKGAEIAVYIIVYYIMLGLWCGIAWIIMKQKHILWVAQRYAHMVVPFLYIGLGIFIIVKSDCYPWSIEHINTATSTHQGRLAMALSTTGLLLICIGIMLFFRLRRHHKDKEEEDARSDVEHLDGTQESGDVRPTHQQETSPDQDDGSEQTLTNTNTNTSIHIPPVEPVPVHTRL